jgi:hypothetical protein
MDFFLYHIFFFLLNFIYLFLFILSNIMSKVIEIKLFDKSIEKILLWFIGYDKNYELFR